jgi:hypothetical protein
VRFELERIVIGQDRRGKEVSTCLVKLTDEAPLTVQYSPVERAKRKLKGHKKTVFKVIEATAEKAGREPPMGIPNEAIDRFKTHYAIEAGQFADKAENELLSVANTSESSADKSGQRSTDAAQGAY